MTDKPLKAATEMLQEFVASKPDPTYEDCWQAAKAILEAADMAEKNEMYKDEE